MLKHLDRADLIREIRARLRQNPAVLLLGPRQCGKTTLARDYLRLLKRTHVFDLESPADFERMAQPMTALEHLRGLVVIDEAQLRPELFNVLRVLCDRSPLPCRFLLLGSASPELASNVSESLAGRAALISMAGFDLSEVGTSKLRQLWLRGGFPRSFLAPSAKESVRWRADFIQTFLERDLRRFGVQVPAVTLRRFWTMLAHYHGQNWNGSEIGRSLGHTHATVRHHLDILTGALVVRQLHAWFENVAKRQVKAPKVYVRDSGILHALLGIDALVDLERHPKLGASWEGFALDQILRVAGERNAWYWATQAGAELDLLLHLHGRRYGIEFKYADAPKLSRSMHVARADLGLEHLFVVHPGADSYPMSDWADCVSLEDAVARIRTLAS